MLLEVHMQTFLKLAITCATLVSSSVAMADTGSRPTADEFFAFDSAGLAAGTSNRLAELVVWSSQHPDSKIVLDGHADSTGADAYNIGLSSRRTDSVQAKLVLMGIPATRIYRGIYGENDLARSSHAQDRRVTIWTTEEPLHALIAQAFHRGTALLWNKPQTAAQVDGPMSTNLHAAR
jgi:hypothetical protein